MTYAAVLGPIDYATLLVDLRGMDRKTGFGWLSLLSHLARFGSVRASDQTMADTCGVGVGFFRRRVWPTIEDRLARTEDGERFYCPDVPAAQRVAPGARPAGVRAQQSEAAHVRWAKVRAERDATHMRAYAETDADAYAPHAEKPGISMSGAQKPDAQSDAPYSRAGASLSLSSSSSSLLTVEKKEESKEESKEERESARASAGEAHDAEIDAPHYAQSMRIDEATGASAPGSRRIPPDWKPAEAEADFARGLGYDPATIALAFRDHYLSRGEVRDDWSAAYRSWCRKQSAFGPVVPPKVEPAPQAPTVLEPLDAAGELLRKAFGPTDYRHWLRDMIVGEPDEDDEATVTLPTLFKCDYIRKTFGDRLLLLWRRENPDLRRLNFVAAS